MKYGQRSTGQGISFVLPLTREWIEMLVDFIIENAPAVLPLTREWIEMAQTSFLLTTTGVLPLTREWIEIRPLYIMLIPS